ncbi:hypothetical protein [Streptomyces sp. NPDC056244]|uniref:hypothetical protein n=1 Tax=Streptomyces sp. NPDC056244 TaxID=3345762 RepID=UPI0035E03DF7
MTQRTELDKPLFGNSAVVTGRMTLADPVLTTKAQALLPTPAEARYGPVSH